jgi:hypothetical protein
MQARIGVTAQQRMLLRVIGVFPGITPGQLARVAHLDRGTISTAIGRLERAGLLERRRTGNDGRSVSVALTRRGKALDVPDPHTIEGALERTLRRTPRSHVAHVGSFIERFIAELEVDRPRSPAGLRRMRAGVRARA